jgi:hypothetical protein
MRQKGAMGPGIGACEIPYDRFTVGPRDESCSVTSLAISSEQTRWLQLKGDVYPFESVCESVVCQRMTDMTAGTVAARVTVVTVDFNRRPTDTVVLTYD